MKTKKVKMKLKSNRELLDKAIYSGCKTVSELALYLKRHNKP